MKYNIGNAHGDNFNQRDLLQGLQDPIPCRDDVIPGLDSISLSILDHPLGKRHEIDFAAYDPPELTSSPMEGAHPVLVLCFYLSFNILMRNSLGVYYAFVYRNGGPEDPMFKLIFKGGEDERTFFAAGSHFQAGLRRSYEITGKWSPPFEDGRIPVKLEATYGPMDWSNAELSGVYDPEENSVKGIVVNSFSQIPREFVFKRNPDFLRFYPAPSIINAGERWKFAATSVLDRIRRRAWSSKRIFRRIKDAKQLMKTVILRYRGRDYSTMLEELEYLAILPGLYEADAELYTSLINADVILFK